MSERAEAIVHGTFVLFDVGIYVGAIFIWPGGVPESIIVGLIALGVAPWVLDFRFKRWLRNHDDRVRRQLREGK